MRNKGKILSLISCLIISLFLFPIIYGVIEYEYVGYSLDSLDEFYDYDEVETTISYTNKVEGIGSVNIDNMIQGELVRNYLNETNVPTMGLYEWTICFEFNMIQLTDSKDGGEVSDCSVFVRDSGYLSIIGVHFFKEGAGYRMSMIDNGYTVGSLPVNVGGARSSVSNFTLNQWYHVKLDYSPTNCSLYVNGELEVYDTTGWSNNKPYDVVIKSSSTEGDLYPSGYGYTTKEFNVDYIGFGEYLLYNGYGEENENGNGIGYFDWSGMRYWLAIIVFIIIVSFAIYVKGGRKNY